MPLYSLSKIAAAMSAAEKAQYREGELGPGVAGKKITPLPEVKKPAVWEFSAHPHHAERAGSHIDIRLGNPQSGIAHSLVLPRRTALPEPGQSALVVPTFDHRIPYMDYFGPISTRYGKGVVEKGRRTQAEVYHADPSDGPGTKLRFNLYEGSNPEEFAVRKDARGRWFIHNKTQTREGRPDIPTGKPELKEIDPNDIDPADTTQAMMPKLDGAHAIIDLQAGRAPRVFSYREAKVSPTGLIEHTHKIPELLKTKVPKDLDRTLVRAEIVGVDKDGNAVPAETTGGLLNSKVWESRRKQLEQKVQLQLFPHGVAQYLGKSMTDSPYREQLKILGKVVDTFAPAWLPDLAVTAAEKIDLLNKIKSKKHPLTSEGVVLVNPDTPGNLIKAKFAPDFDVYVREIHRAVSKEGKPLDRAGAFGYSWSPEGPVVGTVGGFRHDEAKDMLENPDKYVGRVAKVKARKAFQGGEGALFQPRFKEWHLDKGDIEKSSGVKEVAAAVGRTTLSKIDHIIAMGRKLREEKREKDMERSSKDKKAQAQLYGFINELEKISQLTPPPQMPIPPALAGTVAGVLAGYPAAKSLAGQTAAITAPTGRKLRTEELARRIAMFTGPVAGIAGLALAKKYRLADKMVSLLAKKAPKGLIANPEYEEMAIRAITPFLSGLGGSAAGGLATGGITGGLSRLGS